MTYFERTFEILKGIDTGLVFYNNIIGNLR